jgi:hypothetical protein
VLSALEISGTIASFSLDSSMHRIGEVGPPLKSIQSSFNEETRQPHSIQFDRLFYLVNVSFYY